MVCSKCGTKPAVVFVSSGPNTQPKGFCIVCAREIGIKPMEDMLKKLGFADDDLDAVHEQMNSLMNTLTENGDLANLFEALKGENISLEITATQGTDPDNDSTENDSKDEDDFKPGGAPAIPAFFHNMLGGEPNIKNQSETQNKNGKNKKEKAPKNRKHINLYCEDLTKKARDGRTDRIVGRDKEIERVIQILSRRTKNNPCLIGEPGVGKTAIAEGLALRIAGGHVPQRLKHKEVQLLDLTALVAGTQFRGQFENRIKGLTQEVKEAGNIILFIDEVHNIVGAGDGEGSMSAANILKPSLSRGEIQVIGATTFNEYRKHIEKDSALERRFQPVKVVEPSIKETIEVLRGVKGYYEQHHSVTVSDDILHKIVFFSERYITDRFLPDKSIDLLDESCSCASLGNKYLEKFEQLIENKEILDRQEEMIASEQNIDYEKRAKIKAEIAVSEQKIREIDQSKLITAVQEEDLAKVIELWTGIPASRVKENEMSKLANLEEKLQEKIIGQDTAIKSLSFAIQRSRVQISPRRRPASFIFVGPTGVGKTELVKVLSQELFDTPETLIRLDMSEFMEKHSVSKIIGSPPGYIGYEEAGQVTEKVRRRPYSVLLFDEIEKAHPDVLNILLQILDEGKITDAHGRPVNFENTIIVMTSNAGSDKRDTALGFGKSQNDQNREKIMKSLKDFLRPEFIARIDEIIVFDKLKDEDYCQIAVLMLNEYIDTLKEKDIQFTFDNDVCAYLSKKSCTGTNGARDLRTAIRKEVENKIVSSIVHNQNSSPISGIHLKIKDDAILVQCI